MKKNHFIFILVLVPTILLASCSSKDQDGTKDVEDGLIINSISIGLGGEIHKTEVNYTFNLWNRTKKSIRVVSVKPVLDQTIQDILLTKDITNEIDKEVLGNSTEIIKGSFFVDTKGLNKMDIENLDIKINEFIINSQQNVGIYKP